MPKKIELLNNLSNILLNALSCGVLITDSSGKILFINDYASKTLKIQSKKVLKQNIQDVFPSISINKVIKSGIACNGKKVDINGIKVVLNESPIIEKGKIIGGTAVFYPLSHIENISHELDTIKQLNTELEAVFNASYDEIFVTDGKGITLRVNKACERLYDVKAEDLIGKHISDLEKQGIFKPSVTKLALKKRERISMFQTTKSGKRLIVTSNPVFNEAGDIIRIVSTSKDVTEIFKLKEELRETKKLVKRYSNELSKYKQNGPNIDGIVVKSPQMKRIMDMVDRISQVDSNILILGESGVGKNLLAKIIHQKGPRMDKPFVSINCGAIPETLIESELFGYEKGAFTGANTQGKMGLIEKANGGTLFLDEVTEIPFHIQVKFLQVIQEKQLTRVGGIRSINVDFRLIAATNKDIAKLVQKQEFREDLYYRLNVIPIMIPPLRKRKEDLQALIYYFLEKLNKKFSRTLRISPLAFEYLLNYPWPGNVRELENIMERLVVTTKNGKDITPNELPFHIKEQVELGRLGRFETEIMPLKQAVESVEEKLIKKAYKKYKNTYKIAKALKVSQPTVVRKIKKYIDK